MPGRTACVCGRINTENSDSFGKTRLMIIFNGDTTLSYVLNDCRQAYKLILSNVFYFNNDWRTNRLHVLVGNVIRSNIFPTRMTSVAPVPSTHNTVHARPRTTADTRQTVLIGLIRELSAALGEFAKHFTRNSWCLLGRSLVIIL